jgi:response regulator RpfG family c-di-GMP phosphodiesterase
VTERRRAERDALNAFEEAVDCIVRAIELRDIATGAHVEKMSYYSMLIAEALDLPQEKCHAIGLASRLHDVGKIAVPDGILLKSGPLTSEERQVMQRHCEAGHKILRTSQNHILQPAAEIALTTTNGGTAAATRGASPATKSLLRAASPQSLMPSTHSPPTVPTAVRSRTTKLQR